MRCAGPGRENGRPLEFFIRLSGTSFAGRLDSVAPTTESTDATCLASPPRRPAGRLRPPSPRRRLPWACCARRRLARGRCPYPACRCGPPGRPRNEDPQRQLPGHHQRAGRPRRQAGLRGLFQRRRPGTPQRRALGQQERHRAAGRRGDRPRADPRRAGQGLRLFPRQAAAAAPGPAQAGDHAGRPAQHEFAMGVRRRKRILLG